MEQFYNQTKCKHIISAFLTVFLLFAFQLAQSQNHFTTVWQGENGQNHMNFVVVSGLIENVPMGANDEIAVFSGAACVGATKLTQTLTSGVSSTYVMLKASADDGSANGFVENDTIIFKLWNSKTQKEMLAKAVKYRSDVASWSTTGHFAASATSVVEIVSYTEYSQTISLIKGTNLFSTYIIPANTDLKAVMKPLTDKGLLTSVTDELGKTMVYSATSGWVNNIGALQQTEGYSIVVTADCSLTLTGKLVTLPLSIPLRKGWNTISWPKADLVNAMSVVQPLIDQRKLSKVQDEKGNTIEKLKGSTGWKNTIGNFASGEGYKVSVTADATLVIQAVYAKSAVITATEEETTYFNKAFPGNGLNHMNINLTGLSASGFVVGDELAAFDGGICVGSLKLNEQHFLKDQASLIVSSGIDGQSGFSSGNNVQLYGWNAESNQKSMVVAETIDGVLKYEEMSSVLLKFNSLTTSTATLENSMKMTIYPNPAKSTLTVYFSQIPSENGVIEITDITGRRIAERKTHQPAEEFNISAQPAGLYFVKSTFGGQSFTQKLIINR